MFKTPFRRQDFKNAIKCAHESFKQTFQEVFGTHEEPVCYKGETTRLTPSESNVYIQNCLFSHCTNDSHGGAVCCDSSSDDGTSIARLLISQTTFISCKTSSQIAGAIYFCNTDDGQLCICEICSLQCASTDSSPKDDFFGGSTGQFAYARIKDDNEHINQVNYSTIARSRKESTTACETLSLDNGKISLPSVNLTNNECDTVTALRCYSCCQEGRSPSSVTCTIRYTSIVNNTAIEWVSCNLAEMIPQLASTCAT